MLSNNNTSLAAAYFNIKYSFVKLKSEVTIFLAMSVG